MLNERFLAPNERRLSAGGGGVIPAQAGMTGAWDQGRRARCALTAVPSPAAFAASSPLDRERGSRRWRASNGYEIPAFAGMTVMGAGMTGLRPVRSTLSRRVRGVLSPCRRPLHNPPSPSAVPSPAAFAASSPLIGDLCITQLRPAIPLDARSELGCSGSVGEGYAKVSIGRGGIRRLRASNGARFPPTREGRSWELAAAAPRASPMMYPACARTRRNGGTICRENGTR